MAIPGSGVGYKVHDRLSSSVGVPLYFDSSLIFLLDCVERRLLLAKTSQRPQAYHRLGVMGQTGSNREEREGCLYYT